MAADAPRDSQPETRRSFVDRGIRVFAACAHEYHARVMEHHAYAALLVDTTAWPIHIAETYFHFVKRLGRCTYGRAKTTLGIGSQCRRNRHVVTCHAHVHVWTSAHLYRNRGAGSATVNPL